MKIFISWSGDKSKEIASVFKDWIPAVIQAAKPYFSPSDIDKGARWSNEIAKELEASTIGIICLTDDNLLAPWLMFEAGALSKSMEKSRVCPMLFGVAPTDLSGPLVQFQAAPFSKEEVHKVIKTINAQLGDQALEPSVLESVFEKWWPELEEKINKALAKERKKSNAEIRSDRELIEEVLKISRTLLNSRDRDHPRWRAERYDTLANIAPDLVEAQVAFASELLWRSNDMEVLKLARESLSNTVQLLMRYVPELLEHQISLQVLKTSDALHMKIKELDDIPF